MAFTQQPPQPPPPLPPTQVWTDPRTGYLTPPAQNYMLQLAQYQKLLTEYLKALAAAVP